ncbi:hypothetical protein Godav_021104 [Gossypium davidsonii]|uniref:Uncharacterized protein n=1 Tax=Gossypium davidsonii TaxID=34287 RepID=A0A7J8R555_GOSDV|nr:hypothetical protein [Gossypium davidsonii]
MAILQNLRDEDVEWRAPWMIPMRFYTSVEISTGFLCSGYEGCRIRSSTRIRTI